VDLTARAEVANMKQFNGKFGCIYCLDECECPAGSHLHRYYPFKEDCTRRSHQSTIRDTRIASTTGSSVSVLLLLLLTYHQHGFRVQNGNELSAMLDRANAGIREILNIARDHLQVTRLLYDQVRRPDSIRT
jgi:hypothetical protein